MALATEKLPDPTGTTFELKFLFFVKACVHYFSFFHQVIAHK